MNFYQDGKCPLPKMDDIWNVGLSFGLNGEKKNVTKWIQRYIPKNKTKNAHKNFQQKVSRWNHDIEQNWGYDNRTLFIISWKKSHPHKNSLEDIMRHIDREFEKLVHDPQWIKWRVIWIHTNPLVYINE